MHIILIWQVCLDLKKEQMYEKLKSHILVALKSKIIIHYIKFITLQTPIFKMQLSIE